MQTFNLIHGRTVRAQRERCAKAIAENQPWRASNMHGAPHVPFTYLYTGQLPAKEHGNIMQANYVIYSYATPIAWRLADGSWVMPDVKYSISTTRQQSIVRYDLLNNTAI